MFRFPAVWLNKMLTLIPVCESCVSSKRSSKGRGPTKPDVSPHTHTHSFTPTKGHLEEPVHLQAFFGRCEAIGDIYSVCITIYLIHDALNVACASLYVSSCCVAALLWIEPYPGPKGGLKAFCYVVHLPIL